MSHNIRRVLTDRKRRPRSGSSSTRERPVRPCSLATRTRGRLTSAPVIRLSFRITAVSYELFLLKWRSFLIQSGHYIENTSETETLEWVEIYKSDRVADISLTQWLALTPPDVVASVLKVPIGFVDKLKKEKQLLLKG